MDTVEDAIQYYTKHYTFLVECEIPIGAAKLVIGERNERKCRFCGLSKPIASFKKAAHIFPTFIGNRALLSYEECDSCNMKAQTLLENDLDNYLGVYKTVSAIKSRNGVPTYKFGKLRISFQDNQIKTEAAQSENTTITDEINKTLEIKTKRGPHRRQQVYKCFVKMALGLMPMSELDKFKKTINWVMSENVKINYLKPLYLLQTFIPGFSPLRGVKALLLKRKDGINNAPYMIFVILFGNWIYQVVVPCESEDAVLVGKETNIVFFPMDYQKAHQLGKPQRIHREMSSTEIIKNEENNLVFRFGSMQEITPKPSQI